ncbi:T-SNARE affecting a late Golgi compartment protein 1 [Spathaspora sp. JA1]|nr:T-SNARE affecting a late Golgi compartment protein 1 [Spathaspora sp. JA1]
MDPFNEVRDDAWKAISVLEQIISQRRETRVDNASLSQDFDNNYQELLEIYQDLKQAISITEAQPQRFNLAPDELSKRKHILVDLDKKSRELKSQWDNVNSKQRPITTMSNRISQDVQSNFISDNPFADSTSAEPGMTHYQEQQMIQEQDLQLDNIHITMQNLNQQAQLMGNELEDQGFMLDELDYEIDNVDNKLQRGMKRINVFLEKNRETASNWCIGILVVVLCILLVILIIA